MSSEQPRPSRDELEVKMTALILGELPAAEAFELGRALEQDVELARIYARLQKTIELVRETATAPGEEKTAETAPLQLSSERREKLLQQFKTVTPKEFIEPAKAQRRPTLLEIAAGVAILGILAAIAVPNFLRVRTASQSSAREEISERWLSSRTLSMPPVAETEPAVARKAPATVYYGGMAPSPPPSSAPLSQIHTADIVGYVDVKPGAVNVPNFHATDFSSAAQPPALQAAVPAARPNTQIILPAAEEAAEVPVNIVAMAEKPVELGFEIADAHSFGGVPRSGGTGGGGAGGVGAGAVAPGQAPTDFFAGDHAGLVPQIDQRAQVSGQVVAENQQFTDQLSSSQRGLSLEAGAVETLGKPAAGIEAGSQVRGTSGQKEGLNPETDAKTPLVTNVMTFAGDGLDAGARFYAETAPQPSSPALTPAPNLTLSGDNRWRFKGEADQPADPALKQSADVETLRKEVAQQRVPVTRAEQTGRSILSVNGSAATTWSAPADAVWDDLNGTKTTNYAYFVPQAQSESLERLERKQSLGTLVDGVTDVAKIDEAKMPPPSSVVPSPLPNRPAIASGKVPTVGSEADRDKEFGTESFRRRYGVTPLGSVPAQELPVQLGRETHGVSPTTGLPVDPKVLAELQKDQLKESARSQERQPSTGLPLLSQSVADQEASVEKLQDGSRHASDLGGEKSKAGEEIILGQAAAPSSSASSRTAGRESQTLASATTPAKSSEEKARLYAEKKRELEEAQRFRQALNLKIASESIDTAIPKTSMVHIVDRADPNPPQRSFLGELFNSSAEAHARIKIEREQSDITELQGRSGAYDPYFVQTEVEVIQSDAVLGKVVEDLRLNETWARKGTKLETTNAVKLLKNKLNLRPVDNSSLIDIGVKSDKPEEAAKIANKIAEVYRQQQLDERNKLSTEGITALEGRFKEQEAKVAQLQQEVVRLQADIQKTQEPDLAVTNRPARPAPVPQPEVQTRDNRYSTFSLNVSDVSFKLAAASLEQGQLPEPAGIRSEEFINAFDYRDPEPTSGMPVAFAAELARYPFAQNRDLLRLSIKTAAAGRQAGRPLNLVLLVDNSGSMERADRVRILSEALRVLASQLQPQDKFSLVTFSRTARLWADGVAGNEAGRVADELSGLAPQGGTNFEEAMRLGYETARRHYLANGINRVVLLTDGAANLGNVDPEALKAQVEAQRKQGIALDCFGIGWEGYNDDLLETLSRNGDGRYGFINSVDEAATEFAGQLAGALKVAASDVKVQVEFNPARVTAYRQVGYAKHQLTKEQFRDNTVDAAEIAAAEAGNALYVVEVNPRGEGPLGTVRVRYKVPGTSDYREQEWAVPCSGHAPALEQAAPAMRLAASASAFSEWLAGSPYASEVTPDRLLGYLNGVADVYGADARPKKLEWMIRQSKSLK